MDKPQQPKIATMGLGYVGIHLSSNLLFYENCIPLHGPQKPKDHTEDDRSLVVT
jgi:hypothetical protein